jgi:hypothetical protein
VWKPKKASGEPDTVSCRSVLSWVQRCRRPKFQACTPIKQVYRRWSRNGSVLGMGVSVNSVSHFCAPWYFPLKCIKSFWDATRNVGKRNIVPYARKCYGVSTLHCHTIYHSYRNRLLPSDVVLSCYYSCVYFKEDHHVMRNWYEKRDKRIIRVKGGIVPANRSRH